MENRFDKYPENFSAIEGSVIWAKEDVIKAILKAKRCYLYDTCAFRNHALIKNKDALFKYLKESADVVIITCGVLMELCATNGLLWQEHIVYISAMHQSGISVLAMEEEFSVEILKACFCDMSKVNTMLSNAICHTKQKAGAIEHTLNMDSNLKKDVLVRYASQDGALAERVFSECRRNKRPGDNLGEELMAVCLHLLSNIRQVAEYKYLILTDDRRAISIFSKAKGNSDKHTGGKSMTIITTAKLCQLMKQGGAIEDARQIEEIISAGCAGNVLKVICSEMYELQASEKRMTREEFARKVMADEVTVYA